MRTRIIAIIGCFIVAGAIAAIVTLKKNAAVNPGPKSPAREQTIAGPPALPTVAVAEPAAPSVNARPGPSQQNVAEASPPQPPSSPPPARPLARPGRRARANQPIPPAPDDSDKPIARQALILVGADPAAEAVWYNAINDPGTSAHDRQDLIEDLNEDGFADPKNPTVDELPLIENRLALIEQLAPDSMDEVNAAAFAEAYKDLINMHARLTGQ